MSRFATASVFLATASLAGFASSTNASVVYDSLPATSNVPPVGTPSFGYAANSIAEAGDKITLAGTNRRLTTVTVGMSDFASLTDPGNLTFAGNSLAGTGYTIPLTLNIYAPDVYIDPITNQQTGTVGSVLATKTIDAFIPYKPAGYTALTGYNGYYFTENFDLSDLNVVLPDSVVATLAYNTQNSGENPTGTPGPYNSLNYSIKLGGPTIGTDDVVGDVYFGLNYQGDVYSPFAYTGYGNETTAIQINAEATPEPGSLALVGVAGMGLMMRRRRRTV